MMSRGGPYLLLLAASSLAGAGGLEPTTPGTSVSVTTERWVTPALVGRPDNPVLRVRIEGLPPGKSLAVTALRINLRGTTTLDDIGQVEVLGEDGARLGPAQGPALELTFRGELPLKEGANDLRIAVSVDPAADLDHVLDAGCDRVWLSDGTEVEPRVTSPARPQRLALALRDAGDEGAAVYRIPGLATTRKGTLLAVYDVRWDGWRDLPGDIDVGLSRSVDGGRSWEPMKIVLDMGKDPAFRFDGVGDPAILVDRETGTVWVAALWSHGDRGWHGSGPGLSPDETGQVVLVRSDDDGRTWSAPINITAQVKQPEWSLLLAGPGRGISMKDGTLVFAAQYQDPPGEGRTPRATILYSRDHGEAWQLGTGARSNTTEAQVVELDEGTLMLNMRDDRGGSRAVSTTRDLGRTWQEHPTSRRALVEPVCNAALIHAGGRTLLFANPAVPSSPRRRMTLKASPDLGATWPEASQLLLDEGESAGYPALSMIDEETVGVLFEGSRAHLTFMRVPLGEVVR